MLWGSPKKVAKQPEITAQLCAAFPKEHKSDVIGALAVLPASKHNPLYDYTGRIFLHSEEIHIPARIYSDEPPLGAVQSLHAIQRLLLACLLTRHCDGFIRERNLHLLVSEPAQRFWIPPFVLQLVGEYVVEISIFLLSRLRELDIELYQDFAAENKEFMALTRYRVISYWDCYYRSKWPRFSDYPGFQFLNAINLWDNRDARRLLAR